MFSRIKSRAASRRLRPVMLAALLVVMFGVGYALSALITKTEPPAAGVGQTGGEHTGGVALVNPPHQLQDFTLTSKTGEPITLSSLRGQTVALFFGYTHCPDECPLTLASYVRVKQLLGDQAPEVSFVFVSVDGARDTPEVVTDFLDHFDSDFVGMTGDETTLRNMGAEYGLVFSKQTLASANDHPEEAQDDSMTLDPENYFVQHTSPTFLIDREGVLRMIALYGTAPETLAARLQQLIQE